MSIEHILKRHTTSAVPSEAATSNDADSVEDRIGWGLLRGQRERAVSLELRKKDDTVLAVPYVMIEEFRYAPADGITLRVAGREIRIRGRGLNEVAAGHPLTLFAALAHHRVPWVAERSRAQPPGHAGPTIIESVNW